MAIRSFVHLKSMGSDEALRLRKSKADTAPGFIRLHYIADHTTVTPRGSDPEWPVEFHGGPPIMRPQTIIVRC